MKKNIKIAAILIGIFSFFYSVISVSGMTMLFGINWCFNIWMIFRNFIFIFLWVSTLSAIGLFIASFGLYKGKKWGYLLSNICLSLFLVAFGVVVIQHFFPNLIDSTIESGSGWFIFYHFNLNFETLIAPFIALIFIIFLNLKATRRHYF